MSGNNLDEDVRVTELYEDVRVTELYKDVRVTEQNLHTHVRVAKHNLYEDERVTELLEREPRGARAPVAPRVHQLPRHLKERPYTYQTGAGIYI